MIEQFSLVTGLSDHTQDNTTALTSVATGASIIEKHVILDRSHGGPDDSFSLEPNELAALFTDTKVAWEALVSSSPKIGHSISRKWGKTKSESRNHINHKLHLCDTKSGFSKS